MKAMKKILIGAISLVLVLSTAISATAATVSGSISASTVSAGEEVSVTVSLAQTTVSSLGVQVTCGEGLSVVSGQWLQSGLMASFDKTKNKGVFSPGGATEMSGTIFRVTLSANAPGTHAVSVKIIGKNGAETVFEETVTKTVTVPCTTHSFGAFEQNASAHWQTCTACGQKQTAAHSYDEGTVTRESTCTQDGIRTKTCTLCGQKQEESLPATGHRESDWITDEQPQVGVEGSRHTECTVCHTLINQESIPALAPPNTESPATEPEVTDPPPTEPEVTDPPATQPEKPDDPSKEEQKMQLPSALWLLIPAAAAAVFLLIRKWKK